MAADDLHVPRKIRLLGFPSRRGGPRLDFRFKVVGGLRLANERIVQPFEIGLSLPHRDFVLARFLPKGERAEGSKCNILRFSTAVSSITPSSGALLSAPFVTLSREVTIHEDP